MTWAGIWKASGSFIFWSVLQTADFALELSDALLRFEDLAIDPIQFTHQLLSAAVQVSFHRGVS